MWIQETVLQIVYDDKWSSFTIFLNKKKILPQFAAEIYRLLELKSTRAFTSILHLTEIQNNKKQV